MPKRITEKTFFHYIKCPSWVYLRSHREDQPAHNPLLDRLIDDGLLSEKQKEILSDYVEVAEVTAEDPEDAFNQTLVFMREGRGMIYNAILVHGHWIGNPDVLARVEGRSKLGDYYYVAADIKRNRQVRDDYKFQGCFYAELLEQVQKVKPLQGYVITPDKTVLKYLIEEFEAEYKLTLHDIERIIAGDEPPHFLTTGCKQSPWFSECKTKTEACDDISILNKVWREEVARLLDAGIKTLNELANMSPHDLQEKFPGARSSRLEFLRGQAIALTTGEHKVYGSFEFPEVKTELYFDIESDPLRDFDYLFGVLEVTDGEENYIHFLAKRPEEEKKMWEDFCSLIEKHADAPIYHYGWFEREVLDRFVARYGVSEIAKKAFEENLIDLHNVARNTVIFPLSFYSLKDIAKYIGFAWRDEDASGINSVLWFEEYLANRRRSALLKKILKYNEDDVRATRVLKRWLREQMI